MFVKIVNRSKHPLPSYQTQAAAGMDLRADLEASLILKPGERMLVSTGLFIELPIGFEAQVRPRSGLALKHGITVLNSPGTVDADYRGEVKVLLINLSDRPFELCDGERIAQMIIAPHKRVEWTSVEELTDSERGMGGFGSTGTN